MKVYMDLVYLHCGPNNVLKDLFPDAFQKNPDGTVKTTQWRFLFVNFKSKDVRKYLIDSMLHWMRLGCDGFRCDVGDHVPVDFWVEAVSTCQKVNPELVMIDEGTNPEWLAKAFDAGYAGLWSYYLRRTLIPEVAPDWLHKPNRPLPELMNDVRAYEAKVQKDVLMFTFVDNHDTATDDWDLRFDRVLPVDAGNAAFVLTFLRRGLPLIFNGNEIADDSRNSFFGPVEHPARANKTIDWARALQPDGQKRLALIRKLSKLRHDDPVFYDGAMDWVTEGEAQDVIAFVRRLGDRKVFVAANLKAKDAAFKPGDKRCAYNHYREFIEAVQANDPARCGSRLAYAAPLTEALLIGCIALRYPGEELRFDPKAMKFTNKPEANEFLKAPKRGDWDFAKLMRK